MARTRTLLGKIRQYSYSLLRVPETPGPEDIHRFETVIRTVRLSSGICRTTYVSRFDDLDAVVQRILAQAWPSGRVPELHDMAASDGQLSLRWAESVRAVIPGARMTASDRTLYLTEATATSGERYILEPGGKPIQYIRAPFVVSLDVPEPAVYPVNVLAQAWAKRRLADLLSCSAGIRWNGVPDDRIITNGAWTFRQIPLVHPATIAAARTGNLRILEVDAFAPANPQYDAVRVMNLYQPLVFSPEKIRAGVQAALGSLRDGGLLIVGRTIELEGRRNDVSILRKAGGRVELVERLGKGFEFERHAVTA